MLANPPVTAAPNIVFFVVDDMGAHDFAAGGSSYYLTPHIDKMVADGMVFDQAYAAHPRCTPSRYAMMSGRYPARGGVPGNSYALGMELTSVAEAMNGAGYATWFVGKWHLTEGKDASGKPEEHGFAVNIAGGEAGAPGSYEWPYLRKKGNGKEKPIEHLDDGEPGKMLTDHLTEKAEALIRDHAESNSDQPFFLSLCHYGVHTPFEDTQDRTKMFRQRLKDIGEPEGPEFSDSDSDGTVKLHQDNPTYAAMVYRVDESLGRIVAVLEELGLNEDTVIVFTSDHGGLSNRGLTNGRSLATTNAPLRAGKGHLFEGGIRVPMIVKWPGQVAAGSQTDVVTTGTDHYPTFLALANAPLRPDDHVDGKNLLPVIRGAAGDFDRGPIYWHSPRARRGSTGDHNASAIRDGDYKLIHWHDEDRDELFNLTADPSETTDLSVAEPEVAAQLRTQLDGWLAAVDAVEPRNRVKK